MDNEFETKGKIIVIEGTDCSGKETQTNLLLKKLNIPPIYIEVNERLEYKKAHLN